MRHAPVLCLLLAACNPSVTSGTAASSSTSTTGASGSTTGGSGSGSGSSTTNGSSSSGGTTGSLDAGPADAGAADGGLLAARPYYVHVPASYDGSAPWPMVMMLHGYASDHTEEGAYLGIESRADSRGFIYVAPDGTVDPFGQRFWNATDACCNLGGSTVDDVAYLTAVVDDMQARYRIDPKRIFFIGHSNGAFMSQRFACDRASRVAAVVSLAGAQWLDAGSCQPSEPVSVAEVHGTSDSVVSYEGGHADGDLLLPPFPSAHQTVATWAAKDGCSPQLTDAGAILDLDSSLPGNETIVERYDSCPRGDVELWTIQGGQHIPSFNADWPDHALDYLFAHPKP